MDTHHFGYRLRPCLRGQLFMDKYPELECIPQTFERGSSRPKNHPLKVKQVFIQGLCFVTKELDLPQFFQRFHIHFSKSTTKQFIPPLFHRFLHYSEPWAVSKVCFYPGSIRAEAHCHLPSTGKYIVCLILGFYRPITVSGHTGHFYSERSIFLCTGLETANYCFALC